MDLIVLVSVEDDTVVVICCGWDEVIDGIVMAVTQSQLGDVTSGVRIGEGAGVLV